jgi:beta-aspartyl-peptidase (threonine type)
MKFTIAIHGGAFNKEKDFSPQTEYLKTVLAESAALLREGGSAMDAATHAVVMMEDSGLFIAGKGSGTNNAGYYELDASVMDGASGQAGAVASLRSFKNPILAARAVMEKSDHVLLVADGAEKFCREQGLEILPDPQSYFKPAHKESQVPKQKSHGTVGAIAIDHKGRLAAATSTGGLVGKLEGRVGDSPIIGAATYADENVAVSTTGLGEYFIRSVAAYDVAARCAYGGVSLPESVDQVIARIRGKGGWGGLIALDKDRKVKFGFTHGMHRGYIDETGEIHVASGPHFAF